MDITKALKNELIDFCPNTEMLLLFGFTFDDIDNERIKYGDIHRAIFAVFKELANSKNKKMHEAVFTVYLGDHNGFYWVGMRSNIPDPISELFKVKFDSTRFCIEQGQYPNVPLVAKYKYNKGVIVEYDGEEMLGQTRIDTKEWYGSGLKVVYKQILPESLKRDLLCP